ncbi:MAG TPA: Flp pilus assembly protein CpaB [Caulobacteraceae bacterium]|jgi:pilus assembly protein CpaB|nr:Flp pilus assembly protein CpaB [Caulobacteraceae bacterium]
MNPVRLAILLVAAVAAIGLALLLRNMAGKPRASTSAVAAAPAKAMARVLTAARDLPVGTRLSAADMTWQSWPIDNLNAAYITDGVKPTVKPSGPAGAAETATTAAKDLISGGGEAMQALAGSTVKDAILKGEPILARKIVKGGQGGYMSVVLTPGMRAMSIPINAETGAGGFIQPGDRVDLLTSHQDQKKDGQGYATKVVVSNVRVLAVDQTTDPAKNGKSIVGATVTLEVPAIYAEAVAEAKARGGAMLALRSYADMGGGPGQSAAAAAVTGGTVRVFKAGLVNEVAVSR